MSESTTTPMNIQLAPPSSDQLAVGPAAALAMVEAFEIVDAESYELAAEELRSIKSKAAILEERRKGITRPLDEAKNAVMNLFRSPGQVLERAEAVLKRKMLAYSQEQQRLAEIARKQAEAEAAAERARQAAAAAEARRAAEAEAERVAAAVAAAEVATGAERAALDAEIAERAAEADRLALESESRELAAQLVVAATPAVVAPKAAGVSVRKALDFEVVDLLALVRHVAGHPELIHLLSADSVKLRAYVRGVGEACVLPGVSIKKTTSLASRR